MCPENCERRGRSSYNCHILVHSNLVHPVVTTVDRLSTSVTSVEQITSDSTNRENSSVGKADEINSLSFVKTNLKDQEISSKAADIIVAS